MPDDPSTIVARILGCDWGRTIAQLADSALCPARATRRLKRHTASGARWFQLCDRHYALATGQEPPATTAAAEPRARAVVRLQDLPAVRMFGLFVVAMHRGGIEMSRIQAEGVALGLTAAEAAETVGVWVRWSYERPAPLCFDCIRQAVQARADRTDWRPPSA
jgi:hypothetical protein